MEPSCRVFMILKQANDTQPCLLAFKRTFFTLVIDRGRFISNRLLPDQFLPNPAQLLFRSAGFPCLYRTDHDTLNQMHQIQYLSAGGIKRAP